MSKDRTDSGYDSWGDPHFGFSHQDGDDSDIEGAADYALPEDALVDSGILPTHVADELESPPNADILGADVRRARGSGDAAADRALDTESAANRLINLARTDKPLGWTVKMFLKANQEWQENRDDPQLRSAHQVALKRLIKQLRESVGPDQAEFVNAIDATAAVMDDPEVPADWTDVLSSALMFIGIATIAAAGAGAAGALLVNESFWKEAVKGAVAGGSFKTRCGGSEDFQGGDGA